MICNTIGLTSDSYETLYVHGGAEVPEVYGSINYAQPIFYSLKTLTGATSYSFMGYSEPLKSYEIDGNMVQNDTPTPESPIYPQECGDRTRNVMPVGEKKTVEVNGVTFSSDGNGRYHISGTASQNSSAQFNLVSGFTTPESVSKGGQGTLSFFNDKSSGIRLVFCNGTTEIDDWGLWPSYRTVTTYKLTGNKYVDSIKLTVAAGITADMTLMPEFTDDGILPSEFEPYGYKLPLNLNGTTQNIYLSEPLRKIGDYADSINSDGTVTRRIKKLVLTGEENWQKSSSTSAYYCSDAKFGATYLHRQILATVCTHYKSVINAANTSGLSDGEMCLFASTPDTSLGTQEVYVKDNNIVDAAAFKTFLATQYANGTPVTVWYVLAEPITEQVTAPTLTPATGNNALAIDTSLPPSSMSITGHVKPSS